MPPRAIKHSSPESKTSPVEQESKINPSPDVVPKHDSSSLDIANMLKSRQEQYKDAALVAKRNGDLPTALNYVRIVKVKILES